MNIDEQTQSQTEFQSEFQNAVKRTALTKARAVREQLAHKQQSERTARRELIKDRLLSLGRAVHKLEIAWDGDLRNEIGQLDLQFYNLETSDLPLLEEIIAELEQHE